jgi:hypothetical protein
MKYLIGFFAILMFYGCQSEAADQEASLPIVREIATPGTVGAQSRLFASAAGELYLSWVEYLNDSTDALFFSRLESEGWSKPREIARGTNWFVNWADFPALVSDPEVPQNLTAHWLQMRAAGTYDYDIHLTQSKDGGQTWSESFVPHRDSIAAEHGFVSMVPLADQKVFLTWLDGRHTKGEQTIPSEGDHGHGGAMTLRSAVVDAEGALSEEAELDDRVCDCCPTSAALTLAGPIVAYRNRSEEEIRDIYVVRQINGEWQEPAAVHHDNWKIAGCPVNGPVIKARGAWVAVAWFTAPEGKGQVKLALSKDGGANFGDPIRIDGGQPLGRVGLEFRKDNELLLTWLEQTEEAAELRLATLSVSGERQDDVVLAEVEASRQTGVPVIAVHDDKLYFAYTATDSLTQVVTGSVKYDKN